jgi:hypothetical protein
MDRQSDPRTPFLISYLSLRKAIGIIGFALPFVLAFGKFLLQGPGIQRSISSYYHTDMRNVFVGSLCAIGVFLMSYRGYESKDEIAGRLASIFAIGVALVPTSPDTGGSSLEKLIGGLHLSFAGLLFLTFAYFSLVLFTKTDLGKTPTPRKLKRNMVYRFCGYTIVACIFLIAFVAIPAVKKLVEWLSPVFWLEAVAVVAFGVSWLVKGETILKDQESESSKGRIGHKKAALAGSTQS